MTIDENQINVTLKELTNLYDAQIEECSKLTKTRENLNTSLKYMKLWCSKLDEMDERIKKLEERAND